MDRFIASFSHFRSTLLLFLVGVFLSLPVFADPVSLGGLSQNITDGPMVGLRHFINGICYLVGFMFLVTSIKKYLAYKGNISETSLTPAIMYLIMGFLMITIPLIYYVTGAPAVLD